MATQHEDTGPDPTRWQGREFAYPILRPLIDLIARIVARMEFRGLEHIPRQGPAVIMANHVSHLDPLVLVSMAFRRRRRLRFLAVSGLWSVRLVGWLLRKGRMIKVHRGAGAERMVAEACAALDAGQVILVYPEGTIVPPGESRPARRGTGLLALRASAPVVPVAVTGLDHWTGGIPRLRQRVRVAIGAPVDLSPWRDHADRDSQQAAATHILERIQELARVA